MKKMQSGLDESRDKCLQILYGTQKAVTNVELKEKCKFVRKLITEIADSLNIDLKLNK